MTDHPKNFYASMVMHSSYPAGSQPTATAAPPKPGSQPYRSPYYAHSVAPVSMVAPTFALPLAPQPSHQLMSAHMMRPTMFIPMAGYDTFDTARQTGKMYTHNPYASTCATASTPLMQGASAEGGAFTSPPTATARQRASTAVPPQSGGANNFPVYAASEGSCAEAGAVASTLEEQLMGVLGNIPATAMSSRGRHLLLNVLRLQHMDKVQLIYDELAPQFNVVAMDQHGCHVARTLIEYITTSQMESLVPYLEPNTILLMAVTTQHTRRVLQSMFEHHSSDALQPIVQVVTSDCHRLSTTQQGCIAVIRIIEYARPAQKRILIDALVPVLASLATNQFGNYVVQCILKNMDGYVSLNDLAGTFNGHWVQLSCDKYSSNVMERIVGTVKGGARQRIVAELIVDVANLQCLMQNSFGNYVLQAAIGSSVDPYEYSMMYDAITPYLHTSPYGHRIEAKLRGRYEVLFNRPAPANTAAAVPLSVPAEAALK
ncbi:pumilio/PUF RNA binding protein 5 [Novymonas esmeraldas]|uniref:Pumilio/PUF RNA binding protein 5 n=1 Tax=Novymonas esmeraldas TaxID=1808958 RepID=A0AAW0F157_9TRYP